MERWGASDMMERAFSGFKALSSQSKRTWREVFGIVSANPTREMVEAQFKSLLRVRHPDAGGSTAAMQELNQAREEALAEVRG